MPARLSTFGLLSALVACAQAQPPPAQSAPAGAPPPAAAATAAGDPRFDAELTAYPYPFPVQFPDRVDKLVLVNPIGLEDWKTVVPYRSIDAWYEQEKKATPESVREYQRTSYYGGTWKPEYERLIETSIGVLHHPDYPKIAWAS